MDGMIAERFLKHRYKDGAMQYLIKWRGFHAVVSTLCDLSAPQPNLTDVTLIVEEKPLHVSKAYLAYHSTVFHKMFFSEFVEKDKKEIPLEDIIYDEFVELLQVILPSRKPVTAETVECLLRLADRFDVHVVLQACEEFLRGPNCDEILLETKLYWSDLYRLDSLKSVCLISIKSIHEVKALRATTEYGAFSSQLKDDLIDRTLELADDMEKSGE